MPLELKEGDRVRLKDGSLDRTMMVLTLLDCERETLCVWSVSPGEAGYDPNVRYTIRHDVFPASGLMLAGPDWRIDPMERKRMTTDPDEGRRQVGAMKPLHEVMADRMKPEPLKVGDKVRLKAGGKRVMTVVLSADYGNKAVCTWGEEAHVLGVMPDGDLLLWDPVGNPDAWEQGGELQAATVMRLPKCETFPVHSLVRVEAP